MIKYPDDYNPIKEYWNLIESGEEVVSKKIFQTFKKVVSDFTDNPNYHYSHARGNHILEFIENYCRHSKGKMGGQPVLLELWEKAILAAIFGFIDDEGNRKYSQSILIIGKKNGKSLISSCVGLYLLVGDSEAGAEVYSVAGKKDQAKIIWSEAKRMVNKSPVLKKRIKGLVSELVSDFNDGVFKPLASDSDTLDGMNIHGALMDEIHQWKNGKELYDIIADGVSAREQPLIFITSTAGTIREDIYDQKYEEAERVINGYSDPDGYHDEHFIAFVYELDKRDEWLDETMWKKANPGLGTIKNLKTLTAKVEKAKANPLLVKNLVCKEFNIRETSSEAWLTFEQLNNTDTFDIEVLKPKYAIGGVDLASNIDLTSACIAFMLKGDDTIYFEHMYWLPEDLLEKRSKEDKVPYDLWYEEGLLRTTPGNKVHHKYVTDWFIEMQQQYKVYIPWIGYDSWSAQYWVEEMKSFFGQNAMIPVAQGKKTLSSPMKSLGADLDKNKINYGNNKITKWCLSNTSVDIDKNDNIQPSKGKQQSKRIDGLAAMLDAYVVLQDKKNDYMNII